MYFYSHNIGDFDRATRHLTRLERSIYRDLMDVYYETEKPLTLDRAALCRKIIARSNEEATAVEQVLNEFFIETPTGWFHSRCDHEIEAYRASNSQKSAAGKASAAKRAAKRQQALNGNPTTVGTDVGTDVRTAEEQTCNGSATKQETVNSKHKTETKERADARGSRLPEDWHPSDEDTAFCKAERPDLRPSEVAKRFYDYWIAVPGAKGRKLDWPATWRQWVRNEREERRGAARQAGAAGDKFSFGDVDRSGDKLGQQQTMERHNITIPEGDIEL